MFFLKQKTTVIYNQCHLTSKHCAHKVSICMNSSKMAREDIPPGDSYDYLSSAIFLFFDAKSVLRINEPTFRLVVRLGLRNHPGAVGPTRSLLPSEENSCFSLVYSLPPLHSAGTHRPSHPTATTLMYSSLFVPLSQLFCPPQDHLPRCSVYPTSRCGNTDPAQPRGNMTRSRMRSHHINIHPPCGRL